VPAVIDSNPQCIDHGDEGLPPVRDGGSLPAAGEGALIERPLIVGLRLVLSRSADKVGVIEVHVEALAVAVTRPESAAMPRRLSIAFSLCATGCRAVYQVQSGGVYSHPVQFSQDGAIGSRERRDGVRIVYSIVGPMRSFWPFEGGVPIRAMSYNHFFVDFGKLVRGDVDDQTIILEPGMGMPTISIVMVAFSEHIHKAAEPLFGEIGSEERRSIATAPGRETLHRDRETCGVTALDCMTKAGGGSAELSQASICIRLAGVLYMSRDSRITHDGKYRKIMNKTRIIVHY
jgi:hypothetical protein